jgi:hypothetical protein
MKPIDFVKLHLKKDRLEAQLANLKDEIEAAQMELMKQMEEDGVTSFKTPKGNIRWDRKIWASCGGNVRGVIEAMEKDGLDELVTNTVNGGTLSGFVREYDPGKKLAPEEIVKQLKEAGYNHTAEAIKVSEKLQLVVSGKK